MHNDWTKDVYHCKNAQLYIHLTNNGFWNDRNVFRLLQ